MNMNWTRRQIVSCLSASALATADKRIPVVVELFTSEGCSSCPPADEFLIDLRRDNVVPGVRILSLSEHVDYWNRLGWRDPFSSALFSARQQWYAQGFQRTGPYTPQMIVDGAVEFVGSDRRRALQAIEEASRVAKRPLRLTLGDDLRIEVDGGAVIGKLDVVLAITEHNLSTVVQHGENAGKNLKHAAVVRKWDRIGTIDTTNPFTHRQKLALNPQWKRSDLEAVVFVQDRHSRRIVGADSLAVG